ncbi:MurR/RpiR family transcriptional regulator [Brevibacillus fluminis]|uniref:MurR/RpiR family transcriptional regulator n=1 Tax=Brevibacillus fluminis TaxID=511487 RepID=A0A3M8DFW2_9BACL|nr:MurR/RpiR family transcriptional regulator [Brevibacillus fluminis]RNB86992.1 MurR/RpiR family transcriptional regulator [Brevibacillus fluminis]
MLNGGLLRIREGLLQIKPAERNVAHYILENPAEVVRLSVKELSEKSSSSQAAITRMCKNLGLDGFQELKIRIAGDLQLSAQTDEDFKEIRSSDSLPTLIESVSINNIYSIRETLKILDEKSVQRAVEALTGAKRIDFFGVGASQLIALDAQQKFMRINKYCTAFADSHQQLTAAVTLTKDDVAFGISYSGETRQVIAAIREAKALGATTIGLTRFGNNTLSNLVDICLPVVSRESDIRSAATSSRIAQLNIIDILFMGVAAQNYEQSVHYLRETRHVVRQEFHKTSF